MQNKQTNESPQWTDAPNCEGWWGVYTEYDGEWLPVMLEKVRHTLFGDILFGGPISFLFQVAVSTCDEYDGALVRDDGSLDIAGDKHEAYWFKIDLSPKDESPQWTDAPNCEGWWGVYTGYMGEWLPVMLEKESTTDSDGYRTVPGSYLCVAVSTCDEYKGSLVWSGGWFDGAVSIADNIHAAYWFKIDLPPNPDEV